jgi:hypothetical protein
MHHWLLQAEFAKFPFTIRFEEAEIEADPVKVG